MARDAAEIAAMLARQIVPLVAELLPHGKREGAEWRCGGLAGEPGRRLSVHLQGRKAGVWANFAEDIGGDALDLVAGVLYRGDKRAALAWARQWLGLGDAPVPAAQRPAQRVPDTTVDAEAEERRAAALRLFLAARELLAGTPAAAYLAARGIELAELRRQPRALRFHPTLWNTESGRAWPGMVAAVVNSTGAHIATHRTWLAQDAGGVWRKAPLRDPKRSLGSVAGGFIPLWRGASGKPLAKAPEGEAVAIAEGIETAFSVAIACPELRVLSAVSLGNMARLALPPAVRTVIICADNDDAGNEAARRGLDRAVQTFMAEGRSVRIARPDGFKDFNDVLRAVDA